jgi:hypothetical protein
MKNYTITLSKKVTLPRERENFVPRRCRKMHEDAGRKTTSRSGDARTESARNAHQRAARIAAKRSKKKQARALRAVMPENPQCDLLISRSHCNATRYNSGAPVVVPND